MGKRLNKKQLLEEIASERKNLMDLIDTIPKRILTKRGMNQEGWAIKDVLTHLVDWESRFQNWYLLGKSGETPAVPDTEFTWGQVRSLNDKIFRSHRQKSLLQVLSELASVHKTTIQLIGQMSNAELTKPGYYEWTGKSWVLSDYARANTASHYRWARKKIKKWLNQIKQQTT